MSMIRETSPYGTSIVNEVQKPIESENNVSSPVLPELEIKAVADVLGLEKESERNQYSDKLDTLLEWAKSQTKDHSTENLKWIIRSLELKLGTPPLSEKRINFPSRYAYLLMEKGKITSEMKRFEML